MTLKKILFLVLFFTAERIINAQADFRPGYIINLNNDTLYGEIDYRGDLLMSEICRFRIKDSDKEIQYSPDDIVAYRFNEGKYFISKRINSKKVFLEFLIKGRISIYYLRDKKGTHYFLEKEGATIIEIPYEERVIYKNSETYLYTSKKHIGILNYYMQDAPELQSRISKFGEPDQKNLIKLAIDYHNTVCKDSECIIFEKTPPQIILNVEICGGIVKFQNTGYNNEKEYFQTGILMHLGMPRVSEKLNFRTGLLYSTLENKNVKEAVYKIPIQFEYIYPKGVVKPILAYGINIYSPFYQSVAFMGGLNISLYKSLNLRLNYDIDFNPNEKFPLLPKSILSQNILIGFVIRL